MKKRNAHASNNALTEHDIADLWRAIIGRLPRFVAGQLPAFIEKYGAERVKAVVLQVGRAGHRRTKDRLRLLYGLLGEHLPVDQEEEQSQ